MEAVRLAPEAIRQPPPLPDDGLLAAPACPAQGDHRRGHVLAGVLDAPAVAVPQAFRDLERDVLLGFRRCGAEVRCRDEIGRAEQHVLMCGLDAEDVEGRGCDVAGFEQLAAEPSWRQAEPALADATVLLVVTEGATDPDNYASIVGRGHDTVGRVFTALG